MHPIEAMRRMIESNFEEYVDEVRDTFLFQEGSNGIHSWKPEGRVIFDMVFDGNIFEAYMYYNIHFGEEE